MRIGAPIALLLAAAGCGGSGEVTALEGIYQLTSWTHNPDGCDQEGPPAPEQETFSHFYVKVEDALGYGYVGITLCEDIATCRTAASSSDGMDVIFAFSHDDDEGGWHTRSSVLTVGDTCEGDVHDRLLIGEPEVSVRIEEETRWVSGIPVGEDGCDEGAIDEQADAAPCEELTVIQGVYVEPV